MFRVFLYLDWPFFYWFRTSFLLLLPFFYYYWSLFYLYWPLFYYHWSHFYLYWSLFYYYWSHFYWSIRSIAFHFHLLSDVFLGLFPPLHRLLRRVQSIHVDLHRRLPTHLRKLQRRRRLDKRRVREGRQRQHRRGQRLVLDSLQIRRFGRLRTRLRRLFDVFLDCFGRFACSVRFVCRQIRRSDWPLELHSHGSHVGGSFFDDSVMNHRDLHVINRGKKIDQSFDDHGFDLQIVESASFKKGEGERKRVHLGKEGMLQDLTGCESFLRRRLQNRIDEIQRSRRNLAKLSTFGGSAEVFQHHGQRSLILLGEPNIVPSAIHSFFTQTNRIK